MKKNLTTLALLATTSMFALTAASAAEPAAVPMFKALHSQALKHYAHTPTALATWQGAFTLSGHNYSFTMIGTNPATTNVTTNYTVYIIPVKMVYSKKIYGKGNNLKLDPNKDQWNGNTITQSVLNSPIFTTMDWKWGTTDVGTTAYEDAFQRGSFWGDGISSTNTSYHVTITPTVLTEQTIKVSKAQGGAVITNPFGAGKVGEITLRSFDSFIQTTMAKFSQINPTNFPFFLIENVYLTSGGCCIGGYHDADSNGQSYGMASFVTSPGAFSQDIDAISHELGEWYDDPLVNNTNMPCFLEVGDPLEGLANYGTFPVVVGGVTFHPQALAFMEYFGEPANFSANNWEDNEHLLNGAVCYNGQ
jgi:hypothetical protein